MPQAYGDKMILCYHKSQRKGIKVVLINEKWGINDYKDAIFLNFNPGALLFIESGSQEVKRNLGHFHHFIPALPWWDLQGRTRHFSLW